MRPHLFLSYAHGEQVDDARVTRFFADLCTEIRTLTGDDHDVVVGFHDFQNMRAGATWPRELAEALCTAQTFVTLWSPRYFRSQFCGKEWTVYARRVDEYEQRHGVRPSSIIPVHWVPRTVPPPALGDIHHRDRTFPEDYHRRGLRDLMRLELWPAYNAFVGALAALIYETAGDFPLPSPARPPEFHTVPSAFHGPAVEPQPESRPEPESSPASRGEPRPPAGHLNGGPLPRRPILRLDDDLFDDRDGAS